MSGSEVEEIYMVDILEMPLKSEGHIPWRRQTGHSTAHVEVFKLSSLMSASFQPCSLFVTLISVLLEQENFGYVRSVPS